MGWIGLVAVLVVGFAGNEPIGFDVQSAKYARVPQDAVSIFVSDHSPKVYVRRLVSSSFSPFSIKPPSVDLHLHPDALSMSPFEAHPATRERRSHKVLSLNARKLFKEDLKLVPNYGGPTFTNVGYPETDFTGAPSSKFKASAAHDQPRSVGGNEFLSRDLSSNLRGVGRFAAVPKAAPNEQQSYCCEERGKAIPPQAIYRYQIRAFLLANPISSVVCGILTGLFIFGAPHWRIGGRYCWALSGVGWVMLLALAFIV